MAGIRPGKCYRYTERAYTRKSKFKSKGYIKAVPSCKISRFEQGNPKKKFEYRACLNANEALQIRHNALESARQIVNRILETALGTNYLMKIRLYPHHVLRENKMITGAGADRMSTGMQLSFGGTTGLAVQTKRGKTIISVDIDKENIEVAKQALHKARPRLPGTMSVEVIKVQ